MSEVAPKLQWSLLPSWSGKTFLSLSSLCHRPLEKAFPQAQPCSCAAEATRQQELPFIDIVLVRGFAVRRVRIVLKVCWTSLGQQNFIAGLKHSAWYNVGCRVGSALWGVLVHMQRSLCYLAAANSAGTGVVSKLRWGFHSARDSRYVSQPLYIQMMNRFFSISNSNGFLTSSVKLS